MMKIKDLVNEMNRLYDYYEIDKKELNQLTEEQISKGAKGLLANIDYLKNKQYTDGDLKIIKDIYHYYC